MSYKNKDGHTIVVDPNAYYKLRLNTTAYHGTQMLRPRDENVVIGTELDTILPSEAIEYIERL